MSGWGIIKSDEIVEEFKQFINSEHYEWNWNDTEGWTITENSAYEGPKIGFSDYEPSVHTKSFPGWAEALWDDGQIVFTALEYQDEHGIECDTHRTLMRDLSRAKNHKSPILSGLHWAHAITSMWGTYRVVALERGENGSVAKVCPFVFDDRVQPYTFPKWNKAFNTAQMAVMMDEDYTFERGNFMDMWVSERAPVMGLIGGSPMTLFIEDDELAMRIDELGFSEQLLCIPNPTHHIILDEETGDVSRTVSMPSMADWLLVEYDLDAFPTMIGNISSIVGEWFENGTTTKIEIEKNVIGTHPTEWRPVWKDKRKSKRIGMAGLSDKCYHHGFVRCTACNGEVEYCFNRRIETETYKCPHCGTEDAVEIPTLIPFIAKEETP